MPTYKVTVQRSFDVEIQTDTQYQASQLAKLFLGYYDESSEQERVENNFIIRSIEMLENNLVEVVEVFDNEVH